MLFVREENINYLLKLKHIKQSLNESEGRAPSRGDVRVDHNAEVPVLRTAGQCRVNTPLVEDECGF